MHKGNISEKVTLEDLSSLFDLRTTKHVKETSHLELITCEKDKRM